MTDKKFDKKAYDREYRRIEIAEKRESRLIISLDRFKTEMMKELTQRKRLVKIPKRRRFIEGKLLEDAVLVLSVIHVGKINLFADLESGNSDETYIYYIMITI